MKNKAMLLKMLQMQQRLNDETNGIGWENGLSKEGKLINWRRCIYMECAELIDSFAWKHWKNITTQVNTQNVAIEITDIWHFVMSLILEANKARQSLDALTDEIAANRAFLEFCKEAYNINAYNQYEIMNEIELIIHQTSIPSIDFAVLLSNFFALALKCGVNLKTLFNNYIGKNVLNKFRQDHGYKDGSYKKNWAGREDNEILSEVLINMLKKPNFEIDEIYLALEQAYKNA